MSVDVGSRYWLEQLTAHPFSGIVEVHTQKEGERTQLTDQADERNKSMIAPNPMGASIDYCIP